MKNLFTISEFARLRNVNINSLLYYEKLGLLTPAYVNPNTKYRYYSPEQLQLLDRILVAIELGIPLKQLHTYENQDGFVLNKEMMEDAKKIAQEKIKKIQSGLSAIEYGLQHMQENEEYAGRQGVYTRRINARTFVTLNISDHFTDIRNISRSVTELFHTAQKQELLPVLPGGLFLQFKENILQVSIYIEILSPTVDSNIVSLAEGVFSCLQINRKAPGMDTVELIKNTFDTDKNIFLISNMLCEKYEFGSSPTELQVISENCISR